MGQASSIALRTRKRTPYEILEVSEASTMEEITKAYKKLAIKYHPDSYAGREQSIGPEVFSEINNAYDELKRTHGTRRGSVAPPIKKEEPDFNIYACIEEAKKIKKIGEGDYMKINMLFDEIAQIEKITKGRLHKAPSFGYAKGSPKLFYDFYARFITIRHFNVTPYDFYIHYDNLTRNGKRDIDAQVKERINAKRLEYSSRVQELAKTIHGKDPRMAPAQKKTTTLNNIKPKITRNGQEMKEVRGLTPEEKEALKKEYQQHRTEEKPLSPSTSPRAFEEPESRDLYLCELCKKSFKSLNQLGNHTKSKKHREKIEELSAEDLEKLIKAMEEHTIEGNVPEPIQEKQKSSLPDEQPLPINNTEQEHVGKSHPSEESKKDETPPTKPPQKATKKPMGKTAPKRKEKQQEPRVGSSFALSCAKCKEVFETRNQLFMHLKESGHSAPLK
ncbi:DnaJ -like subfamily A member 5 [Nematocida displodere]|uniref:DnaJ-like subfamily A member 5 n=1 Tax=Nematocida displodere TaxID=1805483 RepID=A0A177EHL5_9MICR|nr:DnaJ -like subfamily A member 5 [Nematocida displodere]